MTRRTIILRGDTQRALARRCIDAAPADASVTIKERTRTTAQNDYMWELLSDVSRARPDGIERTPDIWKAIFMHALGHAVRFEQSLDGRHVVPVGFHSSRLTVSEMADLITIVLMYGDQKGVKWTHLMRTAAE